MESILWTSSDQNCGHSKHFVSLLALDLFLGTKRGGKPMVPPFNVLENSMCPMILIFSRACLCFWRTKHFT